MTFWSLKREYIKYFNQHRYVTLKKKKKKAPSDIYKPHPLPLPLVYKPRTYKRNFTVIVLASNTIKWESAGACLYWLGRTFKITSTS